MRPVTRGASPYNGQITDLDNVKWRLVGLWGQYCCYCERRIETNLAVEHIQPVDEDDTLEFVWDNFLLACTNCNSSKGITPVIGTNFVLPDRDNSYKAFVYNEDGTITPHPGLADLQPPALDQAIATLDLVGFRKRGARHFDANGELVKGDRIDDRKKVYGKAALFVIDLLNNNTHRQRDTIVEFAEIQGFFSIWMTLFTEPEMRLRFIALFHAAADCFDQAGQPITGLRPVPPANALAGFGKV